MPSFIVVSKPCRVGETVPAVHLDPGATGWPDRKTSVPVKIRLVPDELLYVDDEATPRSIMSTTGKNNETTFLVTGSSKALRNAELRRELEQASALLTQAGNALLALKGESDEPEVLVGSLGELWNWVHRVRERLEGDQRGAPRGESVGAK